MNASELCTLSATEVVALIRKKQVLPSEVSRAVLDRIQAVNPQLNAYCTIETETAMATAGQLDEAVQRGDVLGPLCGVPISIKDILYVRDSRTTFGSRLFADHVTREDAPSIERLREAGAIFVGRTNTPEFGFKGVTDNRLFGATRNPWNPSLTSGGSSGGAAVAVATGMGPVGIGTDGGGSIRIPASFCGLVGLKASFGRIPNYPATAVDSLRHTGPLTRTVADAALLLEVMAGVDERDPFSLEGAVSDYPSLIERGIAGWRIGFSADLGFADVDPEVARICAAACQSLVVAGAQVEEVDLNWQDPYDCWNAFFYGGIGGLLGRRLQSEGDLLDPGLRKIVMQGSKLRAEDFVDAQFQRNAFWHQTHPFFRDVRLLVTPALAVPPFPIGQDDADPVGQSSRPLGWTPFTYPFNLTGHPAVSVPCGFTQAGLPVGLQIVGARFDDLGVLCAARALEQIQPWADRWPPDVTAEQQ